MNRRDEDDLMSLTYGLEINESVIFRSSRGVSTIATSWWMNYKTTCIGRITDISGGGEMDVRSFIKCDNEIDAQQLRQILICTGQIPQSAIKLIRRHVD